MIAPGRLGATPRGVAEARLLGSAAISGPSRRCKS